MRLLTAIALACAMTASAVAQPATVGTVNIVGQNFEQIEVDFLDASSFYFLEVIYDGEAPLTIDTRASIDVNDTEIALYDGTGNVIQENDDADPPDRKSELVFGNGQLPAGTYFLAVGAFNSTFDPNFLVTSTSAELGDVVVTFETGALPVLTSMELFMPMKMLIPSMTLIILMVFAQFLIVPWTFETGFRQTQR